MKMGPVVRDLLREIPEVWFLTTAWSIKECTSLGPHHTITSRVLVQAPLSFDLYPGFLLETCKSIQTQPHIVSSRCGGCLHAEQQQLSLERWGGEQRRNRSRAPGQGNACLWNLQTLEGKISPLVQKAGKTIFLKINRSQEINGLEKFLWGSHRLWIETASNFSAHHFNSSPLQTWGTAQLVLIPEGSQWFCESGKPHLHFLRQRDCPQNPLSAASACYWAGLSSQTREPLLSPPWGPTNSKNLLPPANLLPSHSCTQGISL